MRRMSVTPSGLFGHLAVERGYCTQEQIDSCLRIQAQLGGKHHLGALLIHRGFITEAQLNELLDLQKTAPVPASPPPVAQQTAPATLISQSSLASAPGGAARISMLLEAAEKRGASDLHLHPNTPLTLRAGGRILVGNAPPQDARELEAQLHNLLSPQQREQLNRDQQL